MPDHQKQVAPAQAPVAKPELTQEQTIALVVKIGFGDNDPLNAIEDKVTRGKAKVTAGKVKRGAGETAMPEMPSTPSSILRPNRTYLRADFCYCC